MVAIAINTFRGEVPRTNSRLLEGNYATQARNGTQYSGRIDPLKGPTLVHNSTITGTIQTFYRYKKDANFQWLVFGSDVNVVRSPTSNDLLARFYYTGDGEPRMSTYADAIQGAGLYPFAYFVLGVVPPDSGATLSVVGGSGVNETRAYVQTFVTRYGEESGPSAALLQTGFINGSWSLTGLKLPPTNSGTVISASMASNIASIILNSVYGLEANERLTIAGTTGITGLNATHTLLSVDTATNTVTVALTATGTAGAGTWARQAPHNTTGMKRRIYRTVGTGTDYKFVAEQAATITTYTDIIATPGEAITSLFVRTPPKAMKCLVALGNGAFAGLNGNELCLSDQYSPHSWPTSNRYSFAAQGVALVPAGNSVIILTDENPYVATASIPEAASVTRMDTYAPCINKRGVVDVGAGAMYPSNDGLYLITPSEAINFTEKLFRINEWQAEEPTTFVAAYHDQIYYAIKGSTNREILAIDVKEPDSVRRISGNYSYLYSNPYDGLLYLSVDTRIFSFNTDNTNRLLSQWESREYSMGAEVNFAAAKIKGLFSQINTIDQSFIDANNALLSSAVPLGGEMGMSAINSFAMNGNTLTPNPYSLYNFIEFNVKSNGIVVATKIVQNDQAFKLPSGYKRNRYTFEIKSKVPIYGMAIASTIKELSQVQI